jgi:MFS family permease
MRWVRRIEILSGVVSIAAALALWSEGAWHWVLLGSGLLALSPWPGPGALVRKAEQKPEILNSDRERGRRRARTFFKILVPSQSLLVGLFGYLTLGVGGAVFMVLMGLLSAAFGFWMYFKIEAR